MMFPSPAICASVFLDEATAWCNGPNKHSVDFSGIELEDHESQGDTSGSEMRTARADEPACGKKRRKMRSRPCKGKRSRYNKFVERLRDTAMEAPHLIDIQSVVWPPSLQNDQQKQLKLMTYLTECKLQQLKLQGEPCTLNPVQNCVSAFPISL